VFRREELLDGLTKLAPTAKKSPSSLVKLEFSRRSDFFHHVLASTVCQ
jgi:hypothetical protein